MRIFSITWLKGWLINYYGTDIGGGKTNKIMLFIFIGCIESFPLIARWLDYFVDPQSTHQFKGCRGGGKEESLRRRSNSSRLRVGMRAMRNDERNYAANQSYLRIVLGLVAPTQNSLLVQLAYLLRINNETSSNSSSFRGTYSPPFLVILQQKKQKQRSIARNMKCQLLWWTSDKRTIGG